MLCVYSLTFKHCHLVTSDLQCSQLVQSVFPTQAVRVVAYNMVLIRIVMHSS